jgi:hypothetical protein
MGFMDKAKKLAEQAQQKLDETQKNFNQSNSSQAPAEGDGVKYDEHGRPVQEAPPAGATAPPAAEPAPPTEEQPAADAPAAPAAPPAPAAPSSGDANAAPDPFKPIQ